MNFLAHLFLSGDNEELMIGNFIGDFVKGSNLQGFSNTIQKGILLHRAIDTYTDNHPVVMESKIRLREQFRHYSPVIVDVFYDHFLAKDWENYAQQPLLAFTQWFYATMKNYTKILPAGVIRMLRFMEQDNWLYNYQFIEGINKALTGLSHRTKFESHMEEASDALEKHYSQFSDEFNRFFPDLQKFVHNFNE